MGTAYLPFCSCAVANSPVCYTALQRHSCLPVVSALACASDLIECQLSITSTCLRSNWLCCLHTYVHVCTRMYTYAHVCTLQHPRRPLSSASRGATVDGIECTTATRCRRGFMGERAFGLGLCGLGLALFYADLLLWGARFTVRLCCRPQDTVVQPLDVLSRLKPA